jgi:putative transposase
MVAATIRTIIAQPGQVEVRAQVDFVADMLTGEFPAVAQLLLDAKADLTAFADFPRPHWQKIWSTNPLSNASIGRSRDVLMSSGSSPTPQPYCGSQPAF